MFNLLLLFLLLFSTSISWANPDRSQQIKRYCHDFVGEGVKAYPNIYTAIKNVLNGLPQEALDKVTNPEFPALFLEMPHFGGGRWANSNGIYSEPGDPPTFTKGIWIVKLSTELEDSKDIDAIEGIVFHELAHFVLGHQGGVFNPQIEKDANHLVEKWGFKKEFLKAKGKFGSHGSKI